MNDREMLTERILQLDSRILQHLATCQPSPWLSVDLTMPQLKVLLIVSGAGGATAGQLARGLGVGMSTVTGIVDRLVEQRLVTRGEDPHDRRMTRVSATDPGREMVDHLYRASREHLGRLLERLDVEELRTVEGGLGHIYRAVVEEAQSIRAGSDGAAARTRRGP